MASIQYSSRLAEMEIPASAVPASNDFTAVADVRGRPMIFAVGNDSIFRLIVEDHQLNRQLINLSQGLGLYSSETVKSFAVNQDSSSKIYLVVSTEMVNMVAPGRLFVLKPFLPVEAPYLSAARIAELNVPANESVPLVAERILLGNKDTIEPYPVVVISYKTTLHSLKQEDIKRINVSKDLSSWSLAADLQLPTHVDKVIDLVPATVARARGIFVLYEIGGLKAILFTAYTRKFSNAIDCPAGAVRIATFINKAGSDDLIIAGDGLFHVPAAMLSRSNASPYKLIDTPAFQNVRDLDISQIKVKDQESDGTKQSLSIWALNGECLLSYLYIDSTDRMGESRAVLVIPEGQASFFSSFLDVSGNQSVVYSDPESNLHLLEQPAETCLWDHTPLIYDDDSNCKTISCYYVPISVINTKTKMPVPSARIRVHGTCWMTIFASGRTYFITPSGTWVDTDMEGKLSLVMPTVDIACSALTIKQVVTAPHGTLSKDGSDPTSGQLAVSATSKDKVAETIWELESGECIIDPTYHTMNVLSNLGSTEDLKAAKTPYGEPVFAGSDVKEEDLKAAGGALKQLKAERRRLLGQPVDVPQATIGTMLKSRPSIDMPPLSNLFLKPNAWIHYAESKIEQAADWVITKLKEGWAFIVEVAGQAWQFILDSVEAISKGIKFVWEKVIKKKLTDLMDYLGFQLVRHVKDIVRTKRLISGVLNATLDLGVRKIGDLADWVDDQMAEVEKRMHEALDSPAAAKLQKENVNKHALVDSCQKEEPSPVDIAIDWIRDRLSQAAKKQLQKAKRPKTRDTTLVQSGEAVASSIWDMLSHAFENIEEILLKVLISVLSIFSKKRDQSITIAELFQQALADIVIGLVKTTGKLVSDVIRMVATVLMELRNILNTPLDVLIFGSLMQDWLGIGLPSVMDTVCFMVAVPATIIRKIASAGDSEKKKNIRGLPNNFTDKEVEDAFTGKLAKEKPAQASAWAAMIYDIQVAVVPLMAIIDVGQIGYAALTAGNGIRGVPAVKKVGGGGKFLLKLLVLTASVPWDSNMPAREHRAFISGLGLGNAMVELLVSIYVEAPQQLKVVAGIDFAVAAISLGVIPFIAAAELDSENEVWIGKMSQSLSYTKLVSECATTIGRFGTNGAVLSVEPTTIAGATGVGILMNTIASIVKTSTYSETLESKAFDVVETAARK